MNQKKKIKNFPFCPENKISPLDNFSRHMKDMKPVNYTQNKKLIYDWTDKKNYFLHHRMLKFYLRHGMVVDKVHELISFRQSKWLEKYINFIRQERILAKNDLEKIFYKLRSNAFYRKTMENGRNRIKLELIKKDDNEKVNEQRSKLTFKGLLKSYANYISSTVKENEVLWINRFI